MGRKHYATQWIRLLWATGRKPVVHFGFDLPGFLPGFLPDLPIAHGGYVVSDLEPVSTSALYQQEISRLEALVARQARQIAEQSVYVGNLTRELARVKDERDRLKASQPRPSGKRYPQRLGGV